MWQEEEDQILNDLCRRFMNRNLFKYAEFDPAKEYKKFNELFSCLKRRKLTRNII